VCCVRPAIKRANVSLWTNAAARRLITDPSGRKVTAVDLERNGERLRVEAPLIIFACGAVNSAALLLRSANGKHRAGLANSSGLVGRRYMAHLATMMQGFHPWRKNSTVFQKTVAVNDFYLRGARTDYPLGQIQSQGRTHGVMAQTVVPWFPLWAYEAWVSRGVDWLVMSDVLPSADNRVAVAPVGRIQLHYRPNNMKAQRRLVAESKRILRRLGELHVLRVAAQHARHVRLRTPLGHSERCVAVVAADDIHQIFPTCDRVRIVRQACNRHRFVGARQTLHRRRG
jgi:choline dehydrogenase-like flavoprotein